MKKSIRFIKKKYKAEQMRKRMQTVEINLPQFLAITKYYRDIIATLGLNTDIPPTSAGVGIHVDFYFDRMFSELNKVFYIDFNIPFEQRTKRQWLSQIELSEEDAMSTRERMYMYKL